MTGTEATGPAAAENAQLRVLRAFGTFQLGLILVSLAINAAAVLLMRSHLSVATLDADEREYWDIASRLHDSGLSGIPARRTLPFPLLVMTLRGMTDNFLHIQLALSTLLAVSPLLTYWSVRRHIGSEHVARFSAIGVLLWPPFVRYGASMYSDSLGLMIFLVYLLVFPRRIAVSGVDRLRWCQFALAGVILGLCLEFKPLYLMYVPIAFLLTFLAEAGPTRRVLAVACLVAGCALVVVPWSSYVSAREGRFILVSANDGETLAGGLNPRLMKMDKTATLLTPSGRTTWVGPGKWLNINETGYLSPQELQLPYSESSTLLLARTRAWIASNPGAVAYLSLRKLLYMWGLYPLWNGLSQTLFGNLPLLALVLVACGSLWVNRLALARLAIFWTLPIFSSLVALVSWGSWRFRMPGDVGLIVLAAVLLAQLRPARSLAPVRWAMRWKPRPTPSACI